MSEGLFRVLRVTSLGAGDKIENDYWMIGKFARKLLLQGQFVRQLPFDTKSTTERGYSIDQILEKLHNI